MKNLSSWYAFMRFQESWYSKMGFPDFEMSDIGYHSESYTIPSSVETVIPKLTKPCVTL